MNRGVPASMVEPADQTEIQEHLADAERRLSWTRRAALIGWGVILYWREGQVRFDAVWIVYALGFAYMLVLHWYVRHRRVTRTTSWIATVFDSVLTYAMCQANGGARITDPAFLLLHDAGGCIPLRCR